MAINVPTVAMVRNRLRKLSQKQLKELSSDSGVPFGTLMKIRTGSTTNPGIETVRAFWPLIDAGEKLEEQG